MTQRQPSTVAHANTATESRFGGKNKTAVVPVSINSRLELTKAYPAGATSLPMLTELLGQAAGSSGLYVNIDRLLPGAKSCKFHSHSRQEEFFLVLSGECSLRLGEQTTRVRAGDFFAKPPGRGVAHQFINDSSEIVEILDVGIPCPDDEITYPDEGVTYRPACNRAWRGAEELTGWTTDANLTE